MRVVNLENQDFIDYVKEHIEASGEKLTIEDLDKQTLQELWNEFLEIKND